MVGHTHTHPHTMTDAENLSEYYTLQKFCKVMKKLSVKNNEGKMFISFDFPNL